MGQMQESGWVDGRANMEKINEFMWANKQM